MKKVGFIPFLSLKNQMDEEEFDDKLQDCYEAAWIYLEDEKGYDCDSADEYCIWDSGGDNSGYEMGLTDKGEFAILADPTSGKDEVVILKFEPSKYSSDILEYQGKYEVCKRDPKKSVFTLLDFKAQNESKDDFVRLMGL